MLFLMIYESFDKTDHPVKTEKFNKNLKKVISRLEEQYGIPRSLYQ
jgi:hypothetical protein